MTCGPCGAAGYQVDPLRDVTVEQGPPQEEGAPYVLDSAGRSALRRLGGPAATLAAPATGVLTGVFDPSQGPVLLQGRGRAPVDRLSARDRRDVAAEHPQVDQELAGFGQERTPVGVQTGAEWKHHHPR